MGCGAPRELSARWRIRAPVARPAPDVGTDCPRRGGSVIRFAGAVRMSKLPDDRRGAGPRGLALAAPFRPRRTGEAAALPAKPCHLCPDCPDCGAALVLFGVLEGLPVVWQDQWVCPRCRGAIWMDWIPVDPADLDDVVASIVHGTDN